MADFPGEDLATTGFTLESAFPGEIPSYTWETVAPGSTTVTTGLVLEAGLVLVDGVLDT